MSTARESEAQLLDNLATALEAVADVAQDRPAVLTAERTVSWHQLEAEAAAMAGLLAEHIQPGDRVAIMLPNSAEFLISLFAATKARAVPTNVNWRYRRDELSQVLTSARARVLVHAASQEDVVEAVESLPWNVLRIEVPLGSDAICGVRGTGRAISWETALRHAPQQRLIRGDDEWLLFTGGTTGLPKAVMSRHSILFPSRHHPGNSSYQFGRAYGHAVPRSVGELQEFTARRNIEGDALRVLPASPMIHGTGLYAALACLLVSGAVVIPKGRSFDPRKTLAAIETHKVTDLVIVGDVFGIPLADTIETVRREGRPFRLKSLARISSTGAALGVRTKQRVLAELDTTIIETVAASEGGAFAIDVADRAHPPERGRFQLVPGARVLDANLSEVLPGSGVIGRIARPAPEGMHYDEDPTRSQATFPLVDGVRYAMPGDHARVERDGTITLLGRGSEVINTGGEKVYPAEVEDVLRAHPAVADVCVTGLPEARFGAQVAAFIEVKPGHAATAAEVSGHVRRVLAGYKVPRHIVFVDEIQRSPAGKTDGRWLAEQVSKAVTDKSSFPKADDTRR